MRIRREGYSIAIECQIMELFGVGTITSSRDVLESETRLFRGSEMSSLGDS
jgi:hypothetical protein